MLKGISSIIPPELLKILMEMGHGDEIIIGDGNFPAASFAKRLVRCDGHGVPEVLDAILKLLPLDIYVEKPVSLMEVTPQDKGKLVPVIWDEYKKVISKHDERDLEFNFIERFDFYDRAKEVYAIVTTGEKALYANIILKKGIC